MILERGFDPCPISTVETGDKIVKVPLEVGTVAAVGEVCELVQHDMNGRAVTPFTAQDIGRDQDSLVVDHANTTPDVSRGRL